MIVLALDTALGACSAAVTDGDGTLASRSEPMTRGHQERLAPLVAEVMAEAGLPFARLERVAVTRGPGSFTGLRVGLAFARTLALALEVPCVGAGVLEALAIGIAGPALAAVPAPQDRLYVQGFLDGRADGPPRLSIPEEVDLAGVRTLVGPGAERLRTRALSLAMDARAWPDPAALARWAAAAPAPAGPPDPLYLRAVDARTLAERGLAPRGAFEA